MKSYLVVVAILGSLTMGATRGCSEAPHRVQGCPSLQCETDCGTAGHQTGADGCEVCACNAMQCPESGACAPECTASTDGNGCAVCTCPQETTSCMQDSECDSGEICDIVNYCDAAPGCADGGGCPAVCYGRCVVPNNNDCAGASWGPTGVCQGPADGPLPARCCEGQTNPCEGAAFDASGTCVSPNGSILAPQCCPSAPTCGDGSPTLCDRPAIGNCVGPLVSAAYNSCTWCFDATTCDRQCFVDSDCDQGDSCQPDANDACNGPTVRCNRPGVMTCQPRNDCPPVCDVYCPYGNVIDASGCETCSCNPPPDECICTREYAPVCGSDNVTYSNACEAECAAVDVAYEGACGRECIISCVVSDPVCGADGVTYNCGAADAACHHTTVAYEGACRDTCVVECLRYEPVCGADGQTYGCGAADAACHNTTVAYEGECQASCEIECLVYQPVCGADGVTYGCGAADATCHNTTVAHEGACDVACNTDSDCPTGTSCFRRTPSPTERPAPQGRCEAWNYCESVADCARLPAPACAGGGWSCEANACSFSCGR